MLKDLFDCQQARDELIKLKTAYTEYLGIYSECEAQKDFTPLKLRKDKIKEAIQSMEARFAPKKRLVNRIKKLPLDDEQKEKLLTLLEAPEYNEAMATAMELDPNVKIPSTRRIYDAMLKLGREKLIKIATVTSKPGLIIVPGKSLYELVEGMDANLHFENQNPIRVHMAYREVHNADISGVYIIDMEPHPKIVPGQHSSGQNNHDQYNTCKEYIEENGMILANIRQYIAAMQRSLRAFSQLKTKKERKDAHTKILDYRDASLISRTILGIDHNNLNGYVLSGSFEAKHREVCIAEDQQHNSDPSLRARAVVTLIE